MRRLVVAASVFLSISPLFADITLTDKASAVRVISQSAPPPVGIPPSPLTPAQKQAIRDANAAKKAAKAAKHGKHLRASTSSLHARPLATGSIQLVDSGGLKYFINTDITFSTSSSASAGMSEASFTGPIAATTLNGGSVTSTLNDMFDGYQTICLSFTAATGPCETGNAAYVIFNKNGPATFDSTVPATPECTNRQVVFPTQTSNGVSFYRKVYVPTNDQFARWTNYFTNTTASPITFNMITGNNLGSDSNTTIVSSSSGDAAAQTTDTWITTFQNYSGTTSSDPRIGHILQGTGAATPVSFINFANGDDNPYWGYTITLNPGQTKVIVNYATGQGSKAAAATKAAAIAALPATAQQCLSNTELSQVVNFAVASDLSVAQTPSSTPNVTAGSPYSYTINVTNNGPAPASNVTVTDTMPAGVTYMNESASGWSCNVVANTMTCTMPSLAVGAANPITLNVMAPPSGSLTNTVTVASSTTDTNPANNSSTSNVTVTASANLSITKTASTPSVSNGQPFFYTIVVNNAGPSTASNVQVTDPLPAGVTYIGANGTGWTCNYAAPTVTCTMPSLAVGNSAPIQINVVATNTPGTRSNVATVSSATSDPTPANNSSAAAAVAVVTPIPTLEPKQLALLAVLLAVVALAIMKRSA